MTYFAALAVLPEALGIPAESVYFKERRRQRGEEQYEKQGDRSEFFVVREGAAKLWVNLADYLDTGLFLDHRNLQTIVQNKFARKKIV